MGANVTKAQSNSVQRVVNTTVQKCPSVSASNSISDVRVVVKQGLTGNINFNQSAVLDTQCVMKTFEEATLKALQKDKTNAGTALGFNMLQIQSNTDEELLNSAEQDCGKMQASNNSISNVQVTVDSTTPLKDLNFNQKLDVKSQCSLDKMTKAIASIDKSTNTTSGITGGALAFGLGSIAVICLVGVGVYLMIRSGGGRGGGGSYYAPPPQPVYAPQQSFEPSSYDNMTPQGSRGYQSGYTGSSAPNDNMASNGSYQREGYDNMTSQGSRGYQSGYTSSSGPISVTNSSISNVGNGQTPSTSLPPVPKPVTSSVPNPIPSSVTAGTPSMNNRTVYTPSSVVSPQTPINPRGSPQIYN